MARKTLLSLVLTVLIIQVSIVNITAMESVDSDSSVITHDFIVIPVFTEDKSPTISIGDLIDQLSIVEDYFEESSYDRVLLNFVTTGWTIIPGLMEEYVDHSEYPNGAVRQTTKNQMVENAINAVESRIDFRVYDGIMVTFSGDSTQIEVGNDSNPAACYIPNSFIADGKTFTGVPVVSENSVLSSFCHELTHWLGADDLYDYLGRTDSIDIWDLMGGGNKTTRQGMCAYTKSVISFIDGSEILDFESGSVRFLLSPLSAPHKEYRALRHRLTDGRVLMIEGRDSSVGYDSNLPSKGLLIYIVNETAVTNYDGGVELQLLNETEELSDAPLKVGESLYLSESNIAIRVIDWSEKGLLVDVSTESEFGWLEVDRIVLDEQAEVLNADVEKSASLIVGNYSGVHTYFLSLLCKDRGWKTVRIYSSADYGRSWDILMDSYGSFNISSNSNSLSFYQDENGDYLKLFCQMNIDNQWIEALLTYDFQSGDWNDLNMSTIVSIDIYGGVDAYSNGSTIYMTTMAVNQSVQGVVCLRYNNETWNYSWEPATHFRLGLTTCSNPNTIPYVFFRNVTDLYMFRFDSSETHSLEMNSTWRSRAIFLDQVYLAYLKVEEENYTFRVSAGFPETGFTDIMVKNTSNRPGFPALSLAGNYLDIIDIDDSWMTYHSYNTIFDSWSSQPSFKISGHIIMPRADEVTRIRPLILSIHNDRIAVLFTDYIPPADIPELIWFFEVPSEPPQYWFIGFALLGVAVIVVVIIRVPPLKEK